MKKNILIFAIIFAATLMGISSCKRDFPLVATTKTTDGSALLAIVDASPNFRSIFNAPDSFNVFINGQKISGFTQSGVSPFITYGGTFPSTTSGFGYIAIPPGVSQIKLSVSGSVTADSIPIATFTKTMLANHQYSFIITDSVNSPRDSSQIFLEDVYNFPPTTGYYNLRFVNAIMNDTANVDLYSYSKNASIYTNIPPGGVTAFTQIGANLQVSDTLYVVRYLPPKVADTTPFSKRLILAKMAFQGGNQKSYTVYSRGDFSLPSSNKKGPVLTFYRHE